MPAKFEVVGPIDAPYSKVNRGRIFDSAKVKDFWNESECRKDSGVYIFCIRTSHGKLVPWYVGRTYSSFEQETFQNHKKVKYSEAMIKNGQGSPLFFFLAELGMGAVNKRAINELEGDFINSCFQINSKLMNDRGISKPRYELPQLTQPGARAAGVKKFQHMLGW